MKTIVVVALLISLVLSQGSISFGDIFIRNQPAQQSAKEPKILNCETQVNNECIQCKNGYFQVQGQCEPADSNEEYEPTENPCGEGIQNCGKSEAANTETLGQYAKRTEAFYISAEQPYMLNINQINEDTGSPDPNRDFSGTNNQQEGVDEADLLKSDGTYIYTISGNHLSILLAFPYNSVSLLSTIQINVVPSAIFVEGDSLALFGTSSEAGSLFTFVLVFNVSDRGNPILKEHYKFEGQYFDGRMSRGGWVYLVSSHPIVQRTPIYPWFDVGYGKQYLNNAYQYQIFYNFPIFLNVVSFDLRYPSKVRFSMKTIVTESVHQIYMSSCHIYLTFTKVENGLDYTEIHKIFVYEQFIIPFADTTIRGLIHNQFALDEFRGRILRVVVTRANDSPKSISVYSLSYHLYLFGQRNNIEPGYHVSSVRYIERRAYLTSQTGSFLVIGFYSHYTPWYMGVLNANVVGSYIHPYDQNHLLVFGRRTAPAQGLTLEILKVDNPFSPVSVGYFELEEELGTSGAEWEHKAFLFSRSKNLVVLPIRLDQYSFNGALILQIKPYAGLSGEWLIEPQLINHHSTPDYQRSTVQRSGYIEDIVYTKSACRINFDLYVSNINKDIYIPCQFP